MKRGSFCLAIFLFLFGVCRAWGGIQILTPPPGATILTRWKKITLVLAIKDRDLNSLHLKGPQGQIPPFGIWKIFGTAYPHFRLELSPGRNLFRIEPVEKEFVLRYRPLQSLLLLNSTDPSIYFFHRFKVTPQPCAKCHTDRIPQDVKITPVLYGPFDPKCISCHRSLLPEGYSKHAPAANWLCRFCHDEGGKIRIFAGKPLDLCTRCHVNTKDYYKMTYIHGPVATGDCTACHDPHAGPYRFQLWANPKGEVCTGCHTDKRKYLHPKRGLYVHGILSGLGCIACHSPHASAYRYQLYGGSSINDWCTSCHVNLRGLKKGHPLKNHPVVGPKDPLRKGHRFGCTSCHNPHGSEFRYLLIGEIRGGHVCTKCHPY